jgi:hypothetical protein
MGLVGVVDLLPTCHMPKTGTRQNLERRDDSGISKLDLLGIEDDGHLDFIELTLHGTVRPETPLRALFQALADSAVIEANLRDIAEEAAEKFGLDLGTRNDQRPCRSPRPETHHQHGSEFTGGRPPSGQARNRRSGPLGPCPGSQQLAKWPSLIRAIRAASEPGASAIKRR